VGQKTREAPLAWKYLGTVLIKYQSFAYIKARADKNLVRRLMIDFDYADLEDDVLLNQKIIMKIRIKDNCSAKLKNSKTKN
jgi:hypothetical protein